MSNVVTSLVYSHRFYWGQGVTVDDDCSDVQDAPPPIRTTRNRRVIRPVDFYGY